jgi:hypothetical protein
MTKKRLLVLTTVVLAAAVGVWQGVKFHARCQRFTQSCLTDRKHCDRIKEGMSRDEVEAILGGPPQHYFDHRSNRRSRRGSESAQLVSRDDWWYAMKGDIEVAFDDQDRVVYSFYRERRLEKGQAWDWIQVYLP